MSDQVQSQTSHSPPLRTPFGRKGGRIVSPADVDSGLGCGCECIGCGDKLIAKKGNKNIWHFAHHILIAKQSCIESAIHAAAKQILVENKKMRLAENKVTVTSQTSYGEVVEKSQIVRESQIRIFDYCREEVWDRESATRPDVMAYINDKCMLIEICFRHAVDEVKLRKLINRGLPAIEINLSDLSNNANYEAIEKRVLEDTFHQKWLFHPYEVRAKEKLRMALEVEIADLEREYKIKIENLEIQRKAEETIRKKIEEEKRKKKNIEKIDRDLKRQKYFEEIGRYRRIPTAEKENMIRKELGISDVWPRHLNLISNEASAVGAPVHIWQAALFAHFIFNKAIKKERINNKDVALWVSEKFGLIENRTKDLDTAIHKFLAYQRGCGFLDRSSEYTYGTTSYDIVYDKLTPPPKVQKQEITTSKKNIQLVEHSAAQISTQYSENSDSLLTIMQKNPNQRFFIRWRPYWPVQEGKFTPEVLKIANEFLEGSAYKLALGKLVNEMPHQKRPSDAGALLEKMEKEHGVPDFETRNLLRKLELID
ncbi:competence protein CoiA family protein [Undibacterium sp. MH2W]|uniref:competence protein CoiA family protein n=1 Tax=Undibacterium sp. MH2W TaxID=3413044 RepID=UPI003BEF6F5C